MLTDLTVDEYNDLIGLVSDTGDPEWRPIVDKLRAQLAARTERDEGLPWVAFDGLPQRLVRLAQLKDAINKGNVELAPSAIAGLREIATGAPGVPVIKLTEHEVVDLVLSGSAFTLDGQYKLVDEDGELRPLEAVWTASGRLRGKEPHDR